MLFFIEISLTKVFLYLYNNDYLTCHLTMKFDKIFLSLSVVILLTTISWIISCTHQEQNPATLPTVCYIQVKSIIRSKCSLPVSLAYPQGCHYGSGEGPDFRYDSIIVRSVDPGNPDASPLYKAIIKVRGENKMPPDKPIAQESRTTIRIWIEQGADTTACTGSKGIGKGSDDRLYN